MTTSNKEKQKRFYASKVEAGESKISCWLPEDDNQRLRRLMRMLDYSEHGKKQQRYSEVISLALKELKISLTPPENRNLVCYGLLFMNDRKSG